MGNVSQKDIDKAAAFYAEPVVIIVHRRIDKDDGLITVIARVSGEEPKVGDIRNIIPGTLTQLPRRFVEALLRGGVLFDIVEDTKKGKAWFERIVWNY